MKKHLIIVTLISAALSAVLAFLSLHYDLIPYPSSVERGMIDNYVKILFAIASFFFAIIVTFFVYSLLFFRRRPGETGEGRPIKGNSALERAWTLIPLIIVIVLSVFGALMLGNMVKAGPPGTELEIDVTAQRFIWQFYYPAYNVNSYELHVPVNRRLHFVMHSKDVIHSFWVQQWGPKQDVVPGLTTEIRYTPTKTGQFLVQCSQLCGYGHTYMTAPVFVTSAADFQAWIRQQQKSTPIPSSTATPSPSTTPSSTPAAMPSPGETAIINLTAQNIAFDKSNITVPAGTQITINFINKDNGIPHNLSVYTNSSATTAIFKGQIITGPATIRYTFTTPKTPGTYFFRCDVHPSVMMGTFVVKAGLQ